MYYRTFFFISAYKNLTYKTHSAKHVIGGIKYLESDVFCFRVDANRAAPAGGSDRSQPAGMTLVSFSVSDHTAGVYLLEYVAWFPFILFKFPQNLIC